MPAALPWLQVTNGGVSGPARPCSDPEPRHGLHVVRCAQNALTLVVSVHGLTPLDLDTWPCPWPSGACTPLSCRMND